MGWLGAGLGLARLAGLGWADLGWRWAGLGWAALNWGGLDWAGLDWANPSREGNTAARRPQTDQKRTKNDAVAGPKTARLNPAKEKLLVELWQGPHQWAALGLGLAGLAGLDWAGLGWAELGWAELGWAGFGGLRWPRGWAWAT